MPSDRDTEWLEKLAKWQGLIGAGIQELNKNQDELEASLHNLWRAHNKCKEHTNIAIAELKLVAQHAGKRWGMIVGLLSGILSGIIVGVMTAIIIGLL